MRLKEFITITWIFLAFFLMIIVYNKFCLALPIFTFVWLLVPLIIVLKNKDASIIGFNKVPIKELIKITGINLVISLSIIAIFELITPTYQTLIDIATSGTKPDITFIWLNEYQGIYGYILLFLFSSFITIFGEELFFRGMLLQFFKRKFDSKIAISLQGILFCLLHVIIALFMIPLQGIILVLGYGALVYGIIGGWAANKTNSIWPNLFTANINNLLLVIFYNSIL